MSQADDEKAAREYANVLEPIEHNHYGSRAKYEGFLAGIAHERERADGLVLACINMLQEIDEVFGHSDQMLEIRKELEAYRAKESK